MLETSKQNPELPAGVRSTWSSLGFLLWVPWARGADKLDILMFQLVEGWLLKSNSCFILVVVRQKF